jgi:hypothetical protein
MIAKNRLEKKWYKSRTIWLGIASVVGAVAMAFVPVVGPVGSAAILAGVGALNIALRATDKGE